MLCHMTGRFVQIRPRLERLYDLPKSRLPHRLNPKQPTDLKEDLIAGPQKRVLSLGCRQKRR